MRGTGDNWSSGNALGTLRCNDGIYVDVKDFRITSGAAKGLQALHPRRIVEDQAIPAAVLGRRLGVGAMMRWTTARASSLPTVCRTTIAACLAYEVEEEGNTLQRVTAMPSPLLARTAAVPRACEQKAREMRQ
jgi:hypothetical protein